jgi:hypothetical protein
MATCYGALVVQALSRIRHVSTLTTNNYATSALIKILKSAFFSATELTVCPIPNFADDLCGALVLWRRAMAPCYGALVGAST